MVQSKGPAYLRFTPGHALPRWRYWFTRFLVQFYYASIRFIDTSGRPLPSLDDTPSLLVVSHRNGAVDGWLINCFAPKVRFLASIQLLRSRFLRLFFSGIPVVREKDEVRYGLKSSDIPNPIFQSLAHLKEGGSVAIFPEGTSQWGAHPLPYQAGALKLIRYALHEGISLRVLPIGSFYQAPELMGSHVEWIVGEPLVFPPRGDQPSRVWEAEIEKILYNALDRVSVHCKDEKHFRAVQDEAWHAHSQGISYALAFKRAEYALAREALPTAEIRVSEGSRLYSALLQLPLVTALFPVYLTAWWVGRRSDGRNNAAFFRILGGAAMAFLWLPCLIVAAILYPPVCLWYGLAMLSWQLRGIWGRQAGVS